MKQVIFLTVNHRGSLLFRELHSTDETIVWKDPGGFEPVYNLFTITSKFTLPEAVTDMYGLCGASHMEQFVFHTMNHLLPITVGPQALTQACGIQVN